MNDTPAPINAWKGALGANWAAEVETMERQMAPIGAVARAALDPQPGERVIDVGSGGGVDTLEIARAVGARGRVTGVDISADLAEIARARLRETPWAQIVIGDATTHPFERGGYDALYSRMGVMFFDDATAAFTNLHTALAPGGRAAMSVFAPLAGNDWARLGFEVGRERLGLQVPPAGRAGPFGWCEPDHFSPILAAAGFRDVAWEAAEVLLPLGAGFAADPVEAAVGLSLRIGTLARALNELEAAEGTAARSAMEAGLRPDLAAAYAPHVADGAVRLGARLWLIRARA
ncbi:MAG: methyltransferase domain-containing protein [Pseudomonadota bacterium]